MRAILDVRELTAMLKLDRVPARRLRVGDVWVDDFGAYVVAEKHVNLSGTVKVLDAYDCGCEGYSPDYEFNIVPRRFLKPGATAFRLEQYRGTVGEG